MIVRKSAQGWHGVTAEGYTPGVQTKVVRHTLVGQRKQLLSDPGPDLEIRYFELPAGSSTRLEKHEHEHYVIVGHGEGHAIVGTTLSEISPQDVIYVAPLEPHQFVNRSNGSMGFFCIVSTLRDFTQSLSDAELAEIMASPAGAYADPHAAPSRYQQATRSN